MRKGRRKRNGVKLTLLLLFVAGFIGVVVFAVLSERTRLDAMASITPPLELEFHTRLIEALEVGPEAPEPAPELKSAFATVTSWSELLRRKREEIDGDGWAELNEQWWDGKLWLDVSSPEAERMAEFFERHAGFMTDLRARAAKGGPVRAVSVLRVTDSMPAALEDVWDCVNLLRVEALVRARSGDTEGAVDDCVAGMQLYDALAPEPAPYSQFARMNFCDGVQRTIWLAFPPGALSAAQAARLIHQAQASAGRDVLRPALGTYLVQCKRETDAMLNEGWSERSNAIGESVFRGNVGLVERVLSAGYTSPLGRPFLNRDAAKISEVLAHYEVIAEAPFYDAVPRAASFWDSGHIDFVAPRTLTAAQTAYYLAAGQANYETYNQLLQIGLTLEQRQAEGRPLPATLDGLSDVLPEATFVDPFSGEPFVYVLEEDGFRLYSVGRNREGDGGREQNPRFFDSVGENREVDGGRQHHRRFYDIVWRGGE